MAVKGINGADLNNISEVDGRYNVLNKVNGNDADLSPPAVAYSVRNLSALTGVTYDGPCMRILVDATGDGPDATDLEYDINFTADGDLDTADIELKCTGGKDAYVVKWYDQSGAGNDAAQTAYAAMPQVCSAGTVITENGKPCVQFTDGTLQSMDANIFSDENTLFFTTVLNASYNNGNSMPFGDLSVNTRYFQWRSDALRLNSEIATINFSTSNHVANQINVTFERISGKIEMFQNASSLGTSTTTQRIYFQDIGNGFVPSNNTYVEAKIQEVIAYHTDQSSNRPTIENNINSYFNIYQSRKNILPGAAAAYSLRQLSSSSKVALRVRRDTGVGSGTDDDEADVGFDANGEVSLNSPVSNFDPTGSAATTLGEFLADAAYDDKDSLGAPADGFVTAWKDQSVNANHATQTAPAAQPQVYDATTGLIKENGKPYLKYGLLTTAVNFGTDNWIFSACGNISDNTKLFFAGSGSSYVGLAQSGSTSSTINSGAGTVTAFRNGSSYSFTTRDALYTDIGTQSLLTINQDNSGWTNVNLGYTFSPDQRMYSLHEVAIYDTDQSSNRTDIEGNINAHYGIENFGTPSSGLLAEYPGSAAAYSVRKLADTAGLSMRIIVDDTAVIGTVDASDTEYDIGFNANGELDVARIREVCNNPSGANYNAYVVTWYDQSGNGNHATQATYTSCPQIYDGTDVIMENGKPALTKNSGGSGVLNTSAVSGATTISLFDVAVTGDIGNRVAQFGNVIHAGDFMYQGSILSFTSNSTTQALTSLFFKTTDEAYLNGSQVASGNAGTASAGSGVIGGQSATLRVIDSMQEVILWTADQSSNRKAIESDIDSYYRIYGDPDDGLLSTPYGKGAAAAYSVRRLSNNATRAMRIIVDDTATVGTLDASDTEYDIGFDANGELDIARIEEVCDKGSGNYNAYVVTWYDQSGGGNDATQAAYSAMPQIASSGSVILENGKPVLNFDGNDDYLDWTTSSTISQPLTLFTVNPLQNNGFLMDSTSTNSGFRCVLGDFGGAGWGMFAPTWLRATITPTTQSLNSAIYNTSASSLYINGSSHVNGNVGSNGLADSAGYVRIGNRAPTASIGINSIQEFILYDSNQSSNRTLIESNINDYFNIEGV